LQYVIQSGFKEASAVIDRQMVNIAVDKSGAVWLEKKEVTLADLGLVLSNRFALDTNLPVYISGDRDTLHGDMVKVYQTVRAAGIQNVAFMTESRNPAP